MNIRKRTRRKSRVLSNDELKRFANIASDNREVVLAGLFLHTALRRSDVANFKVKYIDFLTKSVKLIQIKTKKAYEHELPDAFLKDMRVYLNTDLKKSRSKYLFPRLKGDDSKPISERRLSYIIRDMCQRAGLMDATPHDFRATFMTRSAKLGIDESLLGQATGTSSSTIQQHYKQFTPEERRTQISRLWEDLA